MQILVLFALFINLFTFAAFGMDKYYAIKDKPRICEKCLLMMSIFGGSIGAMVAMRLFRHKRQKFKGLLELILVLQLLIGWAIMRMISG